MFGKTRQRLEEKYVKPVQNGIAVAIVLSVLALFGAFIAIAIALPGVSANAV